MILLSPSSGVASVDTGVRIQVLRLEQLGPCGAKDVFLYFLFTGFRDSELLKDGWHRPLIPTFGRQRQVDL